MKETRIIGKRISLRFPRNSDADNMANILKDWEITKYTSHIPHPYAKKDAIKFIKGTAKEQKAGKVVRFVITEKDKNKLIGFISIEKISKENKNAEVGYWLGKEYWNMGIMTEAVKLLVGFSFKKLRLHRLYAGLYESNVGSRKVLEKSGFKLEGKLIESRFRMGKYHNELRYGMVKKK